MAGKLNLDPQKIVGKEFDIDFKGYNPDQVDQMLDLIIQDYQTYEEELSELKNQLKDMELTTASLRAKVIEYEGKIKAMESDGAGDVFAGNNIDILKRLSRLESEVFNGQKKQ